MLAGAILAIKAMHNRGSNIDFFILLFFTNSSVDFGRINKLLHQPPRPRCCYNGYG